MRVTTLVLRPSLVGIGHVSTHCTESEGRQMRISTLVLRLLMVGIGLTTIVLPVTESKSQHPRSKTLASWNWPSGSVAVGRGSPNEGADPRLLPVQRVNPWPTSEDHGTRVLTLVRWHSLYSG